MGIDWKEKIKEMTPKQFNELMHNLNQARLAAQAALIEAEERYEADSNDDVLESRRVAREKAEKNIVNAFAFRE
ncbi:MAG: hypothetical protein UU71_C0013G0044 [Parcubacteria group bacterium GW2011_GWB1_41_6]|nr:MAG: hypothetical protein UU71_C0013G0044 [Parcubacteria group bacterium GW2011_GWB1_41_6]KKS34664.1 MAG: hypothetical protein UU96_C0001G0019 [Parcubacteria group bacterium GW2011_GWC2_42_13]